MNLYDEDTHVAVPLPAALTSFRGDEWYVLYVTDPAGVGRSGKVAATPMNDRSQTRTFYPSVFGCYIANQPRRT